MAKDTTTATTDPTSALADALLKIAEMTQRPTEQGFTAEQLETVLARNAESTHKALRPENARHPDISAFNPEGERDHPRPKLVRKTFFAGMELHEDDLTATEIGLFNSFTHACVARNGQWRAEFRNTSKTGEHELWIVLPVASVDDRMELPNGMTLILRELLGGEKAVDSESLAQRVALLEKELAAAKVA
jgi:hypothetical protein